MPVGLALAVARGYSEIVGAANRIDLAESIQTATNTPLDLLLVFDLRIDKTWFTKTILLLFQIAPQLQVVSFFSANSNRPCTRCLPDYRSHEICRARTSLYATLRSRLYLDMSPRCGAVHPLTGPPGGGSSGGGSQC
jgi:hypothetical protein